MQPDPVCGMQVNEKADGKFYKALHIQYDKRGTAGRKNNF